MNETFPGHPEQPTEGMVRLGQIFDEMLAGNDLFDGLHEAREAIRKREVTMKDLASEIAATSEERQKLIESGASKEEIDQITLRLLGAQSIVQDLKNPRE